MYGLPRAWERLLPTRPSFLHGLSGFCLAFPELRLDPWVAPYLPSVQVLGSEVRHILHPSSLFSSLSSLYLSGVRAGRSSPTLSEVVCHKFCWPRMGNDADEVHESRYRSRTPNLSRTGVVSPIDESWSELRAYRGTCFPCPVSIAFSPLIVNCDRPRNTIPNNSTTDMGGRRAYRIPNATHI